MDVLVAFKNKEDPNKNEGARVATTLKIIFFTQSRVDNSAVKGRIWLKFDLIRAFSLYKTGSGFRYQIFSQLAEKIPN